MNQEIEVARNIVYLWDMINTENTRSPWSIGYELEDYSAVSFVMRNCKDNWDGLKDVGPLDRMEETVFSSWLNKAKKLFVEHNDLTDSYNFKLELIQRIQIDIKWWKENQQAPTGNKYIDLSILVTSNHDEHIEHPDIHNRWYSMWLDTGWVQDKNVLIEFLIDSILSNSVETVKRIVKEYNIDINKDVPSINEKISDKLRNRRHIENLRGVKLGFFVRSEEMAKTLIDMGFDYKGFNYDTSSNTNITLCSLVKILPYSYFLSSKERTSVIRIIDDINIENKVKSPEINVLWAIKAARSSSDIVMALRRTKYSDIRGEGGENVMHMIAKYKPQFLKSSAKQKRYAKLMNTPDSHGRYPIEYFMCFSDRSVLEKNLEEIEKAINNNNLPRPDWLEVKMLIVEEKAHYSGVDCVESTIWKQRKPQDFRESLRTKRGKKLIHMVANSFQYESDPRNKPNKFVTPNRLYCGMDICKYTDEPTEEYEFLKSAETNNQIKIALIQAWRIFFSKTKEGYSYNFDNTHKKLSRNLVLDLIDKAIGANVDISKLRNKIRISLDSVSQKGLEEAMLRNFKEWEYLETLVERDRLMKIVKVKPAPRNVEPYSVL